MSVTLPPKLPGVNTGVSTSNSAPVTNNAPVANVTNVTKPATTDGVDDKSGTSKPNESKTIGTVVVPLIPEADLQKALATTQTLANSSSPAIADVFAAANDAAQRLQKATTIEVPLRLQVTTGKGGNGARGMTPSELPGMLKENNGVVTFYPADESYKPFDVDAASAKHLPRDTLLLAKTQKKSIDIQLPDGSVENAPVYSVGNGGLPEVRKQFIGVVDLVAGEPFVRDLVPPPRMAALPKDNAGKPWREGAVVDVTVEDGKASVQQQLAEAGTPKARTWMVAASQKLDPVFSPKAMQETEAIEKTAAASLADKSLVDMTHVPFFAIDNDNSKDIDQAMHLQKRADGGYTLSYALADAAHYIKPGSALFEGAMQRGASFYLPGLSISMLPSELSEGVISLNAHEQHRAMVIQIQLAPDGSVEGEPAILRAKIASRAQITYGGVSAELEGRGTITDDIHGKPVPKDVKDQLKIFEEIGSKRIAKAKERGVVEPDRREMHIGFNEGNFFLQDSKSDYASKLNAELSILANVAGAKALSGSKIAGVEVPGIYKVHAEPWPSKYRALARQVSVIVEKNGLPKSWKWSKNETLAAWVDRLKTLPKNDRESALSMVLQMKAVRVNVSSGYERNPGRHAGLQVEQYGRFTAPMREQVGVMSHAVLFAKTALEQSFDEAKLTEQQAAALWAPLLLGTVVEPNKIPQARRALAAEAQALLTTTGADRVALAKRLADEAMKLGPLSVDEKKLVDESMNRAMNAGNTSKQKQGQVEGAGMRLLFDDLFAKDLGGNSLGNPNAPKRKGTVTDVTPNKVYIQLTDPDVEVRLSLDDLKRHCPGACFHLEDDGVSLVGDGQAAKAVARLLVGQEVQLQATHHDGERLHFAVVE